MSLSDHRFVIWRSIGLAPLDERWLRRLKLLRRLKSLRMTKAPRSSRGLSGDFNSGDFNGLKAARPATQHGPAIGRRARRAGRVRRLARRPGRQDRGQHRDDQREREVDPHRAGGRVRVPGPAGVPAERGEEHRADHRDPGRPGELLRGVERARRGGARRGPITSPRTVRSWPHFSAPSRPLAPSPRSASARSGNASHSRRSAADSCNPPRCA